MSLARCREFAKKGWRPYRVMWHPTEEETLVEVISYPWPEGNRIFVNVRMKVGDPTTMVAIELH
jgi:hypothetical protein